MRDLCLSALGAVLLPVCGLIAVAPAGATINLVQNGNFEQTTLAGSNGFGDRYSSNQVTDWTSAGYSFVFASGQADTVGAEGERGHVWLWGPDYVYGNGRSDNGMPDSSPAGGNFIAADGAYEGAPISQLINGLQVGQSYSLSFYWAAAQQMGYNGSSQQNWTVSLGDQTFQTATVTNVSHGFVPWQQTSFTFTPTSTSEILSFLAGGTPAGVPPFTLLDGVSLTQIVQSGGHRNSFGLSIEAVPESATWAMMIVGFGAIGTALRRHRRIASRAL
jgi:hypothetical protein